MSKHLKLFFELGKVRISTLATVSMLTGFVLASGGVSLTLPLLTLGVFLIASGSAAINQIQEIEIDGRMLRTQGRPLPTRRIGLRYAWTMVSLSLGIGSFLIFVGGGIAAMGLGFLAVFWYNGVYTPFKRLTAFAAIPGGVVGAIPPVIGWVAGGGDVLDPRILAVAFFFFVWQVPHFWLLLVYLGGKDYERAGLPSLTTIFSNSQLARITFIWILATVVTCLAIPLYVLVSTPWIVVALVLANLGLVWRSTYILRAPREMLGFRMAFKQINLYVVYVITLLSINAIIQ